MDHPYFAPVLSDSDRPRTPGLGDSKRRESRANRDELETRVITQSYWRLLGFNCKRSGWRLIPLSPGGAGRFASSPR